MVIYNKKTFITLKVSEFYESKYEEGNVIEEGRRIRILSENVTIWLKEYIWLIPILVAIISAILAFTFSRESEKKKRYISIADNKLENILSKMYKEVIEISEIHNNDISKIKEFIQYNIDMNNLYQTFDDLIIEEMFKLYIQINTKSITEDQLIKNFNHLSRRVEDLYWQTLKVASYDYKWWRNTTAISYLSKLPMILISTLKNFFEYIFAFSLFILLLILSYTLPNYSKYSNLLKSDIFELYWVWVMILGAYYAIFYIIFIPIENKRTIKKKKILSKLKNDNQRKVKLGNWGRNKEL